MSRMRLAWRLLLRDGRSGELTLLILSLMIAVASTTTIALFADRLQRTLAFQAAEFLAGDLVLASSTPLAADWLNRAEFIGLTHSQTTEFSSVLLENEQMLLASIKAVTEAYPLHGFLKTRDAEAAEESKVYQGPKPGMAWVESRVLSALQLKLGDALAVGEKKLIVERVLSYEPDKRGDFYSFSPRVMINYQDLEATGVIQPGSHVHYFYQFVGLEAVLLEFKNSLKAQLSPAQRIFDIHEDRPILGSALQRAQRYLGLSSIVVILIAGVAISMAASRYTERHFNASALLRCLGCKQSEIVWLYTWQFLGLGSFASMAGCGLGWLGQLGLFYILQPLLPSQLANPGVLSLVLGYVTGMSILLGFALPPLLRLQKVSPLRVLRRELEPLPTQAWLMYILAISVVSVLVWQYSNDWQMTVTVIGVGLLVLLLMGMLIIGLLNLTRRLLPGLGVSWRFGLQGLIRNSRASVSQILAFSITLAAMNLSLAVRTDLIAQWQAQLPEQAPNHFVMNIIPEVRQAFEQDLKRARITSSSIYPVVRGRLVQINGENVQTRVSKDSQGEAATQRELSLTWAKSLPEDNRIINGIDAAEWVQAKPGQVSVEQKLAENLHINIGDQLQFTIGSAQVTAQVANLRSLQWDTMKPNFYMIFSPGTLDAFPVTYLTSFYLPDGQKQLLNKLVKSYPATTVLEVDQILQQIKTILKQLTQAINFLLYFSLLAGFLVLFAAVQATLDNRIHEGALMRTLGAKRGWLRKTQLMEFATLGLVSGLLAAALSQTLLFVLYGFVMHIPYRPSVLTWILLPLIGAVMVGSAGFWGVRAVLNHSPMSILRRL